MRRKLTVIVTVAALAIFALGGAAVASAHGLNVSGSAGGSTYIDRVAEILGISSSDLQSAMQQARTEEQSAALADRLAQAVTNGVLTQDEADAIQQWYDGKPAAIESLSAQEQFNLRDADRLGVLDSFLAKLVTDGVLTQDESDQIATWLNARPTDALQKFDPRGGDFGLGGPGFGGPGFGGRGHFGGRHGHFGGGGFGGEFGFGMQGQPPADSGSSSDSAAATTTGTSY